MKWVLKRDGHIGMRILIYNLMVRILINDNMDIKIWILHGNVYVYEANNYE